MKNLLKSLLVIAFLAVSFQSNAQIKFGVKAGLNVNSFGISMKDADQEETFKDANTMTIGYQIGLAAEYGLSDALSIQSGLVLSAKGGKIDLSEGESTITSTTSQLYLEIPISFAYNVSETFQIYAGPYVAMGIGGKVKTENNFGGESNSYDYSLKPKFGEVTEEDYTDLGDDEDFFNGLDFGLNVGVGYKVSENILINAGYSLGLGNTEAKSEGDDTYGDDKISNRVISVGATYLF